MAWQEQQHLNWSYLYEKLGTLHVSSVHHAIQIIRDEVIRHLKVLPEEEIYIDPSVNEKIWERGIENPPRKIRLTVIRHDEPDIPIEVKLFEEA